MKAKKEENIMQGQAQSLTLPLPSKKATRNVQGDVDLEVFTAVQREMHVRKLKLVQVLEWGLRAFLIKSNPKAARELGILEEE